MPYQVTCPDCSSKLKSAQPVPAGRPLTCPQCKRVFTLSEPAPEIDTQPVATTPPAPSAPAAGGYVTPRRGSKAEIDEIDTADIVDAADFVPPSKSKAKRRDDDEDDRPRSRARRDDDEDDRPLRSRGPKDDFAFDDDERPKSKRRRDDDDEDDRPRSRRPRDEDEEDDRPRRRRDRDEEDDRPKRGRAAKDEEERPRSKRGRDEDDEDRPRSKRGRDEDDEDLPKSRGRRVVDDEDEDTDDDDRPRSRGRKGKKKPKKALLLALIGGGAALFLLLGCVLVNVFWDPLGLFGGGSSSEMLAWAPADSQMVIFMDVEGMEKVDEMKGTFKGEVSDSTKLGLKSEDVSAVMGAGKGGGLLGGLGGDPDVTIIKLRKSADQKKIIDASGGTEATANGKKYYKTKSGGGLHFASDKLLVVTKTESTMTSLLQKEEGKVAVSDDLRSTAKRGDGLFWIASTGQAAEQGDMIGLMAGLANLGNMFKDGGKGPKTNPPKCKATLMSMKASGNRATGKFESTYDSSDAAKRMGDDLKKAMEQSKNNKGSDFESFDVSTSGATVTLTIVGPINKGKGGFPGFPFGGGMK
jgi:hypothetical protein